MTLSWSLYRSRWIWIMRLHQNGRHFTEGNIQYIFWIETLCILIQISPTFYSIRNYLASIQLIARVTEPQRPHKGTLSVHLDTCFLAAWFIINRLRIIADFSGNIEQMKRLTQTIRERSFYITHALGHSAKKIIPFWNWFVMYLHVYCRYDDNMIN